ncbi:MAG: outer membrane beta-barrel protein [Rhodospirillaceae bacterium]
MKKIGVALALGLAFTASGAGAQELGPYVGLGVGLHMPEGSRFDYDDPPGTLAGRSNVNFRLGFNVAASVGYRWSDFLRIEAELSHRSASLDDVGDKPATGSQKSLSLMANVLFDVGVGENFHPYIGGGIGLANNSWNNVTVPTSPVWDDSQKKMQWQAIIGLEMPINAQAHWFADYRYIGSTDNGFHTIPPQALAHGIDIMSHNVLVGVRYAY